MIERYPKLALALTTLVGIGIIIALYLAANDPGPPPETDEERFERVHTVFVEAFAGGAAWSGRVEILGLQTSRTAAHSPGWQITGTGGACDASGSYILRDNPANALAITAPHSLSDTHTGELAQLLFEDTGARGAAWNTAPRAATQECASGLDLTTDRWHPFSAFALAFADSHRDGLVVQLHGYEDTVDERPAELTFSFGSNSSTERTASLAACLSEAMDPRIVRRGATEASNNNAQRRVLQRGGHSGFVYLELSEDLRRALLEDTALRSGFAACLVSAAAS